MQYIQVLLEINIQQLYLSDSLTTPNPALAYWKLEILDKFYYSQ